MRMRMEIKVKVHGLSARKVESRASKKTSEMDKRGARASWRGAGFGAVIDFLVYKKILSMDLIVTKKKRVGGPGKC